MGVGIGRAKILVFGEHSAVYGAPAVGLSLPWTLEARLTPGQTWTFAQEGPHEPAIRALVARIEALAPSVDRLPPPPGCLSLATRIPLGCGFGSSGALCAALVDLFYPGLPEGPRDLLAWEAEKLFHGTPSGIDTALALRTGWWRLDPSVRPATASPLPDPGLALVTGALVRTGDTRSLVGNLARRRTEGDTVVVRALEILGEIAAEAAEALADADVRKLPDLMAKARGHLAALGLESPVQTAVIDRALQRTGALAGKLSGAGGGGAFVLLYPNQTVAEQALAELGAAALVSDWLLPPTIV